ncbi:hypothetical protein GLA29479_1833 [Lysobacter antibioticus]|nr:hypothetical protein GLA29479_1833 [Lysobacter antibioticus]
MLARCEVAAAGSNAGKHNGRPTRVGRFFSRRALNRDVQRSFAY